LRNWRVVDAELAMNDVVNSLQFWLVVPLPPEFVNARFGPPFIERLTVLVAP
jgi:hypothetical protein